MERIINISIFGHPLNWVMLIVMIVLIWFGIFAVSSRLKETVAIDEKTSPETV